MAFRAEDRPFESGWWSRIVWNALVVVWRTVSPDALVNALGPFRAFSRRRRVRAGGMHNWRTKHTAQRAIHVGFSVGVRPVFDRVYAESRPPAPRPVGAGSPQNVTDRHSPDSHIEKQQPAVPECWEVSLEAHPTDCCV
jgi:hypothetical protein